VVGCIIHINVAGSGPTSAFNWQKRAAVHRRNLLQFTVRGVSVPHFLDRGVLYPSLFRTKKWRICCHQLSTETICGHQITIKPFSAGTPLRELTTTTLSQTQESYKEGLSPPHSPHPSFRAPQSLSLVPPLFRPQFRPWCSVQYTLQLVHFVVPASIVNSRRHEGVQHH